MKKSAIKMIAGVSALAIFSSISATAIPAFAEEYDAIQEQDYVATFADEQTQNVANYLLEKRCFYGRSTGNDGTLCEWSCND